MESFGSILDGDWSSINAMYSTAESEFMVQLLDYCSVPNDLHFESDFRIPSDDTNFDQFSLGNTCFYPALNHDSYHAGDFNHTLATNDDSVFCNEEAREENLSSVRILPNADVYEDVLMYLELEAQAAEPVSQKEVVLSNPVQKSNKRSANPENVKKNKRSVKAKKNQKHEMAVRTNNTKEKDAALQKRSSSSCSSENDSIASLEVTLKSSDPKEVTTVNKNGELRAVRGSATDPQSLYARKRRERINEKLRTLQNLVPNGTKVDISTMLEDAVQYVKFLQLQIKLLSSDKWMYAPISYNGTNLGLDSNLSLPLY